jgi:purine-binding chemotaxis protein CheW
MQLVTFKVAELYFAMDILNVREIISPKKIFDIPRSPKDICGLLNLRGQIVSIVDMGNRVLGEPIHNSRQTRAIVLRSALEISSNLNLAPLEISKINDDVGLLVSKMEDLIDISTDDIEDLPANMGDIPRDLFYGMYKNETKVHFILKINQILTLQE